MSEDVLTDDQSHYEVSLTAGQAFLAFVLLLLSLAASFAFGLMIGRGQADDRLVVRKEPTVVNEASVLGAKKSAGRIVELGVPDDDFKAPPEVKAGPAPQIREESGGQAPSPVVASSDIEVGQAGAPVLQVSYYAQLASTSDQKSAENLAAKLIDKGFTSAYVERGTTDKGQIFRVRVKFQSEAEARAAEGRLREFSREVWITKQ
jgi:cell division septation protein DedD